MDEQRNLLVGNRIILSDVPESISVLPNVSPQGLTGSFLGSTFDKEDSHHVFRIGVLRCD